MNVIAKLALILLTTGAAMLATAGTATADPAPAPDPTSVVGLLPYGPGLCC